MGGGREGRGRAKGRGDGEEGGGWRVEGGEVEVNEKTRIG